MRRDGHLLLVSARKHTVEFGDIFEDGRPALHGLRQGREQRARARDRLQESEVIQHETGVRRVEGTRNRITDALVDIGIRTVRNWNFELLKRRTMASLSLSQGGARGLVALCRRLKGSLERRTVQPAAKPDGDGTAIGCRCATRVAGQKSDVLLRRRQRSAWPSSASWPHGIAGIQVLVVRLPGLINENGQRTKISGTLRNGRIGTNTPYRS